MIAHPAYCHGPLRKCIKDKEEDLWLTWWSVCDMISISHSIFRLVDAKFENHSKINDLLISQCSKILIFVHKFNFNTAKIFRHIWIFCAKIKRYSSKYHCKKCQRNLENNRKNFFFLSWIFFGQKKLVCNSVYVLQASFREILHLCWQ